MRKVKIYIHTINGRAGVFDGDQICYASRYMEPAYSLGQIRKEQRLSIEYRRKHGYQLEMEYGYHLYRAKPADRGGK